MYTFSPLITTCFYVDSSNTYILAICFANVDIFTLEKYFFFQDCFIQCHSFSFLSTSDCRSVICHCAFQFLEQRKKCKDSLMPWMMPGICMVEKWCLHLVFLNSHSFMIWEVRCMNSQLTSIVDNLKSYYCISWGGLLDNRPPLLPYLWIFCCKICIALKTQTELAKHRSGVSLY